MASVAVPQYQTYTLRTEATTASTAALRPIKNAVEEYVALNGENPSSYADLATVGFVRPDTGGVYANDTAVNGSMFSTAVLADGGGVGAAGALNITFTFDDAAGSTAPSSFQGETVVFVSTVNETNGSVQWTVDQAESTLPNNS